MWNTHTTKHFLWPVWLFCHIFWQSWKLFLSLFVTSDLWRICIYCFLNDTLNSRLFILKSALSKFTIQNRNLKQYFFNTFIFKCCYCLFYVFLKSNIYSLRCMYKIVNSIILGISVLLHYCWDARKKNFLTEKISVNTVSIERSVWLLCHVCDTKVMY